MGKDSIGAKQGREKAVAVAVVLWYNSDDE